MALQMTNVPVKLTAGVDTKSDPKSLQTKLTVLQNASFQSPGQLEKRDGFAALSQNILGGGTVSAGVGIASFQSELNTMDGSNLYSYSQDLSEQVNKGLMVPVSLSVNPVIRNIYGQSQPDSAYHPGTGLQCFTWTDSSTGGVNYSVVDSSTGTEIVSDGTVSALTPGIAKVLTLGNFFLIIVNKNASVSKTLTYYTINTAAPSIISSPTSLFTSSTVDPVFDATIINGAAYICLKSSSTALTFYSISASLVLSSSFVVTTGNSATVIAIKGDASFNVWVSYATSSALYALIVNSSLTSTLLVSTLVDTTINISNITLIISGTTASIYYEIFRMPGSSIITVNTMTFAGVAGAPVIIMRGVGLASKVFVYNGVNYLLSVYAGAYEEKPDFSGEELVTLQPTYFLINGSGKLIAKLAPSLAGLYYISGLLPEIVQYSATNFSFAYLLEENTTSVDGAVFFQTGVMQAFYNFILPYPTSKLFSGENLLLGSGQLWDYDGQNIVEQGFHIYPENLIGELATSGGGIGVSLDTGTITNQFQYIAIYEWVDNQGQLNRSAASPALTVPILASTITPLTFTGNTIAGSNIIMSVSSTAGLVIGQVIKDTTNAANFPVGSYITQINSSANQVTINNLATLTETTDTFSTSDVASITVIIPTLRQTLKQNVSVVLYRTQNNQTIFYRVTSPTNTSGANALTFNNPSIDNVSIVDNLPDSVIIGNEQLYTTGGEVSNFNAPAISALVSYKNRAVYLSPENPFQYGYSKQVIGGSPVEFSSLLFNENIDQRIGKATALGVLDDKLIIFGPNVKFWVVGDGPSPSGANNDFSEATRIAGTTGCINPASVIEIPIGLIYKDPVKGITLLDRSLQEQYIGADVESYNQFTITSSSLVPNSHKCIFTLSNGMNLTYDYFVNQWEVDIFPVAAIDSTLYQGNLTYIQANGLVLQQTPGVYSDNGAVIPMSLQTGWIPFAGLQGFGRVWELIILGTYFSPHTLNVTIYTDFSTTPAQVVNIPVISDPGNYEFRIHLKVQKCTSMMINITESQSGSPGQGLSLSGLSFRVGAKKGQNKLSAGASF